MVIADISIAPLGTKTSSVSKYVAMAIKILQQEKDIKYELTPMGTVVEGDLDGILRVTKKMHEAILGQGIMRVITTIKIDERRDKRQSMKSKVNSVEKKLGKS
ncbi:MAG: MTH1187 family thiamine-binding protein [Chloroflexota bacterium]|nr:MTH1187 family thiamine-binding protein [Chloroflexota bacterium]